MSWLTKKEAAEYLSVCESTIDNLESEGLIAGRRIFRRPNGKKPIVRYKQKDLDNLFEKRQRGRPREDNPARIRLPWIAEKRQTWNGSDFSSGEREKSPWWQPDVIQGKGKDGKQI